MPEHRLPLTGRLVFGFVVILLGVLFTLDNLGVLEAGELLRWWPAAFVVFGISRLAGLYCRQRIVAGIVFTLVGALLLLREAGFPAPDPWAFWPILLVAAGISMVSGTLRRARGADAPVAPDTPGAAEDSLFSTFVMWSGVERKVGSLDFRGGDVTAIMGGAEIDLRQAKMPAGRAVVDVMVLWGGLDLFVPPGWKVTVEALPLMAGVEDATRAPAGETSGHLVVKGLVLMGGVDIKN